MSNRKVKHVGDLSQITDENKYGTFFNSLIFGLGNNENASVDSKLFSTGLRKVHSNNQINNNQSSPNLATSVSASMDIQRNQDLLGLA